jgi:hypothetical protein
LPIVHLIPGNQPGNAAQHRQTSLNGQGALIARLPLGKQRAVIEAQSGRVFNKADVERCASKQRGENERS